MDSLLFLAALAAFTVIGAICYGCGHAAGFTTGLKRAEQFIHDEQQRSDR